MSAPTKPSAASPRDHRDMPTPRVSGSFSAFRDAAQTIVEDLAPRRGVLLADALVRRAVTLRDAFDAWPEQPPNVVQRSDAIQQLIELREQVTAYLHGR